VSPRPGSLLARSLAWLLHARFGLCYNNAVVSARLSRCVKRGGGGGRFWHAAGSLQKQRPCLMIPWPSRFMTE
jgi:hypothetical protein